jgi:hypothetical protein
MSYSACQTGPSVSYCGNLQTEAVGGECRDFTVLCSEGKHNRFLECDDNKNIHASNYHVREPETQRLKMGFGEFAQCARKWTTRHAFFKVRGRRPTGATNLAPKPQSWHSELLSDHCFRCASSQCLIWRSEPRTRVLMLRALWRPTDGGHEVGGRVHGGGQAEGGGAGRHRYEGRRRRCERLSMRLRRPNAQHPGSQP